MVGTHRDITRERQAEAEAAERRAIELASRAKSEFLSRMSHEMRTPLNALLGFAQLLQQHGVYRADYLQHMLTAGTHLHRLINDVLDVQQVEQGVLVMQRLTVDLAAMVAEVNSLLLPQAEQAGVRLGPAPEVAAFVLADPQRVRQVLLNLVSNGIKYNRTGGSVHLVLRSAEAGWATEVRDTGLGLSPDQQAHLYEPFNRLGAERLHIEGTGLGLAISRHLVLAMKGTLSAESTVGVGSSFTITLPHSVPLH
jgi:signal transduction histidine kinase